MSMNRVVLFIGSGILIAAGVAALIISWPQRSATTDDRSGQLPLPLIPVDTDTDRPLPANLDSIHRPVAELIRSTVAELDRAPDDATQWIKLGMVYQANSFPNLAQSCYERAVLIDSRSAKAWYYLAVVRDELGETDSALVAISQAIGVNDTYAPAHWQQGRWLLDRGGVDAAESAFRRAIAADENDPESWIGLGRLHSLRTEDAQAIAAFQRALELTTVNERYVNHLLAGAYRRIGRPQDAEAASQAAGPDPERVRQDAWLFELEPLRVGLLTQLRQIDELIQNGQSAQALRILDPLRAAYPERTNVILRLGAAYQSLGQLDESQRVLEQGLTQHPDAYRLHFQLSATYLALASRDRGEAGRQWLIRALAAVHRSLELNSSYAPAHGRRADLLIIAQDYDGALGSYQEAARYEPTNGRWPYRVGVVHTQLQQPKDAAESFREATRLAPQSSAAFYNLGVMELELEHVDAAETALHQAQAILQRGTADTLGGQPVTPQQIRQALRNVLERRKAGE